MKNGNETTRAQEAVRLLMHTDRLHRSAIETQVEKLGIHRSQHIVLMNIAACEDGTNQSRIAKCLNISDAAVSVTVKKLEKAGLVSRHDGKDDAREKKVSLTEEGRRTAEQTHVMFTRVDDAMCSGMTDRELDALCLALSKMIENLKSIAEGPEKE